MTDDGLCDQLLALYKRGANVTVLVSDYIVSESDYYKAQVSIVLYHTLYNIPHSICSLLNFTWTLEKLS